MRRFRPTRLALLVALVGTLALLCCGGSVSAILIGGLGDEEKANTFSLTSCGKGGPIDEKAEMPKISDYGPDRIRNAAIIINVGADLKLPPRAWVIAVATAMQESGLNNLGDLGDENDNDSLGLFQQRPSSGWGTVSQVQDPVYASRKFYDKLRKIRGWEKIPLTEAAQRVQNSAYPDAYAKHELVATEIVNNLANGAANAVGNSLAMVCTAGGQIAASGWTAPAKALVGSGFETPDRPDHHGVDLIIERNEPIAAAASGVVSVAQCDPDAPGSYTCDVDGSPSKSGCGWYVEIVHAGNVMTRYCHMVEQPSVEVGQKVKAGDIIGHVGTSGNSSGPHLHFEVHENNDGSSEGAIDPVAWMQRQGAPLEGQG